MEAIIGFRRFLARDGNGLDVLTRSGWKVWETVDVDGEACGLTANGIPEIGAVTREWRDD